MWERSRTISLGIQIGKQVAVSEDLQTEHGNLQRQQLMATRCSYKILTCKLVPREPCADLVRIRETERKTLLFSLGSEVSG